MKKRRLLSIVLSLCMVLAFMPQMVFAEEPGNYDELQGIMNDAADNGTVTLTKDYTINNTVTVYDTTLDLNGHVIKMTGNGSVIKVDNSSNFTLQDSSEGKTGVITSDTGSGPGFGGGVYVDELGSFTMNGGTIYNCSSLDGGGVNNRGTLYANGGTIRDSVYNRGLIENATTDGCTVFYGGINIVDSGTINGKTVTFKKDDNTYAVEIVKAGNKAIEPTIKPDAPEGKKFAGWYTDKTLITSYDFDSGVTNDIILYARFDPIISITVPFTTKVELGGNMQPDETVFNMQVLDSNGDKYSSGNVKIEAKPVTTNGAGSYGGKITFTGTEAEIFNMFRYNGSVFVKQEDAYYLNWKIDDTVWCLFHSGVAELSEGEVEPFPILIYPASLVLSDDGTGYQYKMDEDADAEKLMTFTNTYTKSEAALSDSDDTNGDADNADKNAKTGDDTNLALWLALMLLSGAGITGTTLYTRRKRTNE